MMKFVSWNVNGLRACIGKGFEGFFTACEADIFAVQETKGSEGAFSFAPEGYNAYWSHADKKGYSGTAVFAKAEPLSVRYGIGIDEFDSEGRVITLEYPRFFFVCVYTPNSQRELTRLTFRMRFEDAFRAYLKELDAHKAVIICGDMNVAHKEIDLKNPASNRGNAGFTDEERSKMSELQNAGFTDTFRALYPDKADTYTWWSYMFKSREHNTGWRIDYFLISDRLRPALCAAQIYSSQMGSDHCPVGMELNI